MASHERDKSPSATLTSTSTNGNEAQRTSNTAINANRHQLKASSNLLRESGEDVGHECNTSGKWWITRQRRMTEIVVVAETVAPFVDYLVAKGSEGV
jgi:hypothetical protein